MNSVIITNNKGQRRNLHYRINKGAVTCITCDTHECVSYKMEHMKVDQKSRRCRKAETTNSAAAMENVLLDDSIVVNGTCLTGAEFDSKLSEFTGHVDGTGEIVGTEVEGDSLWVKVRTDKELLKYIVPKGFIAVDGTSLTVVNR
ncbi:unnamed protein product [Ilex paraguariensis]|uniref:Lumazine-binding domain-containing protein n=1 Tax=Ilex paraguariensis TaxID=185542 RepID=A0ABC8T3J0_9AQUA